MNRNISVEYIVKSIMKKKIIYAVLIIVCVCGMMVKAYTGYNGSEPDYGIRTPEWYQEQVQEYEDAIEDYKVSIATIETELANIQGYCDNAEYMKIDTRNIAASSRQYVIVTDNTNNKPADISRVAAAYQNYIAGGQYMGDMDVEEIDNSYIKELVTSVLNSNTIVVTVIASKTDISEKIANQLDEIIMDMEESYETSMGDFDVIIADQTTYTKVDANVITVQNTYLDKLRVYETSLADQKKLLTDGENALIDFQVNNDPANRDDIVYPESFKKTLVKHGIFGFILAVAIVLAYEILRYVMSNTIKSKENLLSAGVTVLGQVNANDNSEPELSRIAWDIEVMAKVNGCDELFVVIDGIDMGKYGNTITELVKVIKGKGVNCQTIELKNSSAEDIIQFVEAAYCFSVVQLGYTTYTEFEEIRNEVERYRVKMMGSIVVD